MNVLRDAVPADLDVLSSMNRAFCAHFDYPYSEDSKRDVLARILAEPQIGRVWLIVSDAGDVAGYLYLAFYTSIEYGGRTGFIDEIFVREEHRLAGLGTAAIENALSAARALGLLALQLEAERSNDRATALYVRLGFIDYDRRLLTRSLYPEVRPTRSRTAGTRPRA